MTKFSEFSESELAEIGNSLGLAVQSANRALRAAVDLELVNFYKAKVARIQALINKVNGLELK